MKLNKLVILISTVLIISCNNQKTTISGKLFSSKSKTVYLSVIDHFDYLNDGFIIDSTAISENGEFKFKSQNLDSKLISLSTEKLKPFTYQILSVAPHTYFYGNCEKFFTNIPTFYISNEKLININWYENFNIDSISSPDNSGNRQVKLRAFYLNSKNIEISNLDYENKQKVETNWNEMLIEKDFDLKIVNLKNIYNENNFDNYLYTEIYLGHLNTYLNWFEKFYPENVNHSINNPNLKSIYSNIFLEYNNHKWNSKSLEYYKFTERYINHYMNIQSKTFKNYYKPTEKKRNFAAKRLNGKNRERYLILIDKQIKNIS